MGNLFEMNKNRNLFTRILAPYVIILFVGYIFARLISPYWERHVDVFHTIFELLGIFIAFASFLIVWHTYERNHFAERIMGFGFLAVVVFDLFHICYFGKLGNYFAGYLDLGIKYWVMGRFTEAIAILLLTLRIKDFRICKWLGTVTLLIVTLGSCYLVLRFPFILPTLFTKSGLTQIKIYLEYAIMLIYALCIYNLRHRIFDKNFIKYEYIIIALLVAITSEYCFTVYKTINSFYAALGHTLRLIYYFCLYKGIFASTIDFAYENMQLVKDDLERSNKQFIEVLDGLPIAIARYDNNLRITFLNRVGEEILKYKKEELIGKHYNEIMELFGAKDYQDRLLVNAFDNEYNGKSTIRIYRDKYNNDIKLKVGTLKLENGILRVFSDAKKEQEIANLRLQTQTILNSIDNTILVVDKDEKIVICNKAYEEIMEVSREDIVGMHIDNLNKSLGCSQVGLAHKLLNGEMIDKTFEASVVTPRGNRKEMLLHVSPIHNVDGEIIGAVRVGTDITEYKQEQRRLQQQEKLVLIGQMTAGLVHEIRNPLTTIKGYSQMIIPSVNDAERVKRYATSIDSAVNDLNKVITEFLAFSKPLPPVFKKIRVNELIRSMNLMLIGHSFARGVDIQFDLCAEEKKVMLDDGQIKQVVLNIVRNAIEAMDSTDAPKITLKTSMDSEKREMILTIKDNGRGMSEQDLAKIGTPFYTTKNKGTGLGLSICLKIIKEHGGRIEIRSKLGKGTSFKLILPFVESRVKDQQDYIFNLPGA